MNKSSNLNPDFFLSVMCSGRSVDLCKHCTLVYMCSLLMLYWTSLCVLRRTCKQE
jgi:hypothetical protein